MAARSLATPAPGSCAHSVTAPRGTHRFQPRRVTRARERSIQSEHRAVCARLHCSAGTRSGSGPRPRPRAFLGPHQAVPRRHRFGPSSAAGDAESLLQNAIDARTCVDGCSKPHRATRGSDRWRPRFCAGTRERAPLGSPEAARAPHASAHRPPKPPPSCSLQRPATGHRFAPVALRVTPRACFRTRSTPGRVSTADRSRTGPLAAAIAGDLGSAQRR
jgi:hypothetical protein